MANILITYANDKFINSAWRLKLMAKRTHFFDRIKIYTPKDLPLHIKASPLFQFKRGGGYWIWKPYIIDHALKQANEGDVVYYIDAGCKINSQFDDWSTYDKYLKEGYDSIFFKYNPDFDYPWGRFGTISVKLKYWIKPLAVDYFKKYFGDDGFMEMDKIKSGLIIVKKRNDQLIIDEWLKLLLLHPQIDIDPYGEELTRLPQDFNQHRHDQSILAPLVYYYAKDQKALVLNETGEAGCEHASVVDERYIAGKMPFIKTLKFKLYYLLHTT